MQHFDVLSRLTSLMHAKGWTRYRLAKKAGLSTTTINNLWLRNNVPTIFTLEDICRALGITMAEFFTLPGEKPPAIAKKALAHAKDYGNDIIILDTAGRLQIDEVLMQIRKHRLSPAGLFSFPLPFCRRICERQHI